MVSRDLPRSAMASANSVQKPKQFGSSAEGKEAELSYKLGLQLPYMFIVSRLAHYLKVIQREHIGTWIERKALGFHTFIAEMPAPYDGETLERWIGEVKPMVDAGE